MEFLDVRQDLAERYPQWAGLINRLEFRDVVGVTPADNDGRTIYYNSRLMRYYTRETMSFYMAQQLLHLQLAHHARGAGKDRRLWKRASDAVVNALLKEDGFQLPEDAPLPEADGAQSAEELYAVLLAEQPEEEPETDEEPEEILKEQAPELPDKTAGDDTDAQQRQIDDPGLAAAVAGLAEMLEPSMQLDFDWFPGDVIRDGMLRYSFRAYPVAHAEILLDTSASVDEDLLRAFVRGVKALLREDAVVRVGCFDTQFYGFQDIHTEEDIQKLELRGFGGTNFTVAVNAFTGDAENQIIFTDGYAELPDQICDAVWVVCGNASIQPKGGRVLYMRPHWEKEKHEINFLIT